MAIKQSFGGATLTGKDAKRFREMMDEVNRARRAKAEEEDKGPWWSDFAKLYPHMWKRHGIIMFCVNCGVVRHRSRSDICSAALDVWGLCHDHRPDRA